MSKFKIFGALIAFALSGIALASPVVAAAKPLQRPMVQTETGEVRGVVRRGVEAFRGIPYAAPPTGDRRWRAPVAPTRWNGVRDAAAFGPACPQLHRFNLTDESLNEDCLSLNVSRPRSGRGRALPVLVYIHGGAFVGGSSNLYRLDALVGQGRLVVVSLNYRLGVLGFMPHRAFDRADNGAYGLEDQRAALAWVRRNIAAFGGDARNVTVAGESAGAGSICVHIASPEAKGLFDKAIILSGACAQPLPTVDEAVASVGDPIASAVGCKDPADVLACLRRAPLKALLTAGDDLSRGRILTFAPTVGGAFIPRQLTDVYPTGEINRVPVLIGGARHELRLYVGYAEQAGLHTTPANYVERLKDYYGDRAAAVAAAYPVPADQKAPAVLGEALSDFNPLVGISNCLYLKSALLLGARMPVHEFEFADPDAPVLGVGITAKPDPGFPMGAVHSAMLNYLFPHMSNTDRIDAPDLPAGSKATSGQMIETVANFARTGVPGARELPPWPAYAAGGQVMRFLPGQTGLIDGGKAHHCDFWRTLYPTQLAGVGG